MEGGEEVEGTSFGGAGLSSLSVAPVDGVPGPASANPSGAYRKAFSNEYLPPSVDALDGSSR